MPNKSIIGFYHWSVGLTVINLTIFIYQWTCTYLFKSHYIRHFNTMKGIFIDRFSILVFTFWQMQLFIKKTFLTLTFDQLTSLQLVSSLSSSHKYWHNQDFNVKKRFAGCANICSCQWSYCGINYRILSTPRY